MNLVILKGRLTHDVEVRYTNGGNPMCVASFSIAVNRVKKDDGADYINCTAFGKVGELFEKYVKKGNEVAIVGHWQTGNYTNKDGNKVYTNTCIVDKMEFCGSKTESSNSAPQEDTSFMNIPDELSDEIPFN